MYTLYSKIDPHDPEIGNNVSLFLKVSQTVLENEDIGFCIVLSFFLSPFF